MVPLFEEGTIAAFGLYLARTGALVISAPLIGFGTGFSAYKAGLVFALALLLYTASGQPLADGVPAVGYAALALREVLIGLFLSFLLHLVFVAVRVAGELVGHEMGFLVAKQVDPATGIETPLITSIYENVFLLALLSLNGHHVLVRSLGRSLEHAPVGSVEVGTGVAPAVVSLFGEMFRAGIVFAAPVMVFLGAVSILIGLLSRAVPNMNVLEVGFTVRVLVAIVAMFLFAPLLEPSMTRLLSRFQEWTERGLAAIGT